ncbi:MAG: SSU ribosomal protein S16p, partial [uncultured Solirubrobacteraceae bacterium]
VARSRRRQPLAARRPLDRDDRPLQRADRSVDHRDRRGTRSPLALQGRPALGRRAQAAQDPGHRL